MLKAMLSRPWFLAFTKFYIIIMQTLGFKGIAHGQANVSAAKQKQSMPSFLVLVMQPAESSLTEVL
jgi:hypothetical protein